MEEQITEYAVLQFMPTEIELILQMTAGSLTTQVKEKQGTFYAAYKKGQLLAEATLRKSIYDMAKQGSSPAQKQFLTLIEKREKKQQRRL